MRAVNDHAFGNSVESCKDESKLQEKWEDEEVKILENGKNNNNTVCELFYDTRTGDDWDKESDGNTLESNSCGDSNEAGKETTDTIDPVFYMDKNVTACDLPEIVVCYKESTYHVVKDICVDEGVPVQEKFLFGEEDSVKCSSEDFLKAEKANVNLLETKSLDDDDYDSELCNEHKIDQGVEESSKEDFTDAEGSSNINQEDLIVMEEAKDENSKDEVVISSEDILTQSLTLGDILSREDELKSLNSIDNGDRLEEQSLPQLQDKEKTEEPEKAEEKHSSVSTTTSQEPNKTCNEPEKPETEENQRQNLLVENSYEEDKLFPSGFGETSFSAAESVSISGHITYSGPIAFSGSLSVRSDASTTSGRSFAFPILQSEWNSSPVRMAKADKRRQKGWRHVLLCCRFS